MYVSMYALPYIVTERPFMQGCFNKNVCMYVCMYVCVCMYMCV